MLDVHAKRGCGRREFIAAAGLGAAGAFASDGAKAVGTPASAAACCSVDVCVLGGSCTGVFAAVRAAQRGCSVALVENEGFFGGTAVGGLVPVWHSLYDTTGSRQIIFGLTDEIEKLLVSRGAAVMKDPANPSVGACLNVQELSLALDELVARHGKIRPFLHARVTGALRASDGRVTDAIIEDKSGRRLIRAKFFIDCTGDADFAVQAGFSTWKPPRELLQAHTTCALLSGLDKIAERHPDFALGKIIRPGGGADLRHCFWWQSEVVGSPSLRFVAGTRVSACDPSDADDLTRGELEGRAQLRRIVEAVNRRWPMPAGAPRAAIAAIAPSMGIRESRHIEALYRVTRQDVLSGRRYDDVIARGSYRIDIHEGAGITFCYLDGRRDRMVQTANGDVTWEHDRWCDPDTPSATWYEVPYRSIVPKGSVNVLCAGRMLDCTRDAYGALRVMVNCNQMGEAAGAAAARAVKENLPAADAYAGMGDAEVRS